MSGSQHIMVSLEARHAESILAGHKKVELRRRRMHVDAGTVMWIYVKQPIGSVVGCVRVASVCFYAPSTLWRKFGAVSGLTRLEFFDYFCGVQTGAALVLGEASRLGRAIPLAEMRSLSSGFQPPQFFARLDIVHPLHEVAKSRW